MTKQTIPPREEIPAEHRWDLTPLFASDDDWDSLYTRTADESATYASFQGRLHESATVLAAALQFDLNLGRDVDRLYTYAHLKSDQDKSNQRYLGMHQRALHLHTRVSELSSFMTPEIQTLPADLKESFLAAADLAEYRFHLHKILRYTPHTREPEVEELLAQSREMAQTASQVFGQLDNVDLDFGTIEDAEGREVQLSHGNFNTFLINPRRTIRQKTFFQYYRAYQGHRHTIASILGAAVKKDLFYARARRFDTCRQAALFDDDMPVRVYDNLIATVRSNLDPLFRYLDFRRTALGLDELHFYDTYVPLVEDVDFNMPYEEAVAVCLQALEPLGAEYVATLADGLRGGWVDRYENRGKRSGAYSSGCYDSPPYILLNYEENNINSLYTLIHEAGHSMHSHAAKAHQPYVDHQYTIFVAEVASTFNENLLGRHLLDHYAHDPRMQAYILNREIDNIRATLYRQTMFAEFELVLHRLVEDHKPPTLEAISDLYRQLLGDYFGQSLVIDDQLCLECLRIPHFYSPFYVYKYATGISAAIALSRRVIEQGNPARDAYLDFLKLGGSSFPLEQLRQAGVDMRTPEPVAAAIRHFEDVVDRFMEVYGRM